MTNIMAHHMPGDTSRNHMMRCLVRDIGKRSPVAQEQFLARWAKGHSAELTDWLRVNANTYRLDLITQQDAKAAASKQAARQALEDCRRMTA